MLKKRMISVLLGLALLASVGVSGLVADAFGLEWTESAQACNMGGSGGGSC